MCLALAGIALAAVACSSNPGASSKASQAHSTTTTTTTTRLPATSTTTTATTATPPTTVAPITPLVVVCSGPPLYKPTTLQLVHAHLQQLRKKYHMDFMDRHVRHRQRHTDHK